MLTNKDTSKKTFESLVADDTTKKANTFSEGDSHGYNTDSVKSSLQYVENNTTGNQVIGISSILIVFIVLVLYILKNKFTVSIKKKTKPPTF